MSEIETLRKELDALERSRQAVIRTAAILEAERDSLRAVLFALLAACRHDRDGLGPRVLEAMDCAERTLESP